MLQAWLGEMFTVALTAHTGLRFNQKIVEGQAHSIHLSPSGRLVDFLQSMTACTVAALRLTVVS